MTESAWPICFIVIFAQSAATSRAYALRYRDEFNQNIDLVGLCLANAAAGCSSTFVVNGSTTKTAMVDTAGGRSQWSHLTKAAVVLMVLLFFTRPLSFLLDAVLAAIVFMTGVKLVDYRGLADIRHMKPREFALALVTGATVVIFGVERGILLAVILSLLRHVRHSYRPPTGVIVREANGHWRLEEDSLTGEMPEPGLMIYGFGADLFYANVAFLMEQVRKLVEQSPSPLRWLVVDATAQLRFGFHRWPRNDIPSAGLGKGRCGFGFDCCQSPSSRRPGEDGANQHDRRQADLRFAGSVC